MLSPRPRARPGWSAVVRPRWLAWHAFAACAAAGMLWLGDWQLRRAQAGNELSWAYTFEWPLFAVLGAVFWVKTIREELGSPRSGELAAGGEAPGERGTAEAGAGGAGESRDPAQPGPAEGQAAGGGHDYAARLRDEVRQHGRWHGLR